MIQIFEFEDYKDYLGKRFAPFGETRGLRAKLARELRCQGAYISQVLRGSGHFSLEHAAVIDEFLKHGEDESEYFFLLIHIARSGSKKLEKVFRRRLERLRKKRRVIAERIAAKDGVPPEARATYYSAWYYAAIHVLLMVPQFQSAPEIASYLRLPRQTVSEALELLVSAGLAVREGTRFRCSVNRLHLHADAPDLAKHHVNWRLRALSSLDAREPSDLHYSGVMALSEANAKRLRALLLNAIEGMEKIIALPLEEAAFGVCLDFFRV